MLQRLFSRSSSVVCLGGVNWGKGGGGAGISRPATSERLRSDDGSWRIFARLRQSVRCTIEKGLPCVRSFGRTGLIAHVGRHIFSTNPSLSSTSLLSRLQKRSISTTLPTAVCQPSGSKRRIRVDRLAAIRTSALLVHDLSISHVP